ncbi:hypothetical protein Daus18300_009326 [Diaporthe australafricana]|uniref:2EXR domain-containing protein n=1 Tax=Diaporthe australafricana TaxID=127596 RepID=A0ABR3WEW1_9PEZI
MSATEGAGDAPVKHEGDDPVKHEITDPPGPMDLFRLSPELRQLVWKFLLPDRKVLTARSSTAQQGPYLRYRRFGFHSKVSQPILSQICVESRKYLLNHGQFIFGLAGEAGLWWRSEDVLLFDQNWSIEWDTSSLKGLKGLDSVKNIALDAIQATCIQYIYTLSKSGAPDYAGSHDASVGPIVCHGLAPQSITLYYSYGRGLDHFLKHFKVLESLIIIFECASKTDCQSLGYHSAAQPSAAPISHFLHKSDAYDYVTFVRGCDNMDDAIGKMRKLRGLWMERQDQLWLKYRDTGSLFKEQNALFEFCVNKSDKKPSSASIEVSVSDMMADCERAL